MVPLQETEAKRGGGGGSFMCHIVARKFPPKVVKGKSSKKKKCIFRTVWLTDSRVRDTSRERGGEFERKIGTKEEPYDRRGVGISFRVASNLRRGKST